MHSVGVERSEASTADRIRSLPDGAALGLLSEAVIHNPHGLAVSNVRFRGFDKNFWIAMAIAVPSLIGLLLVSGVIEDWVGLDRIFILLVLACGVWFALHLVESRLKRSAEPETEPVFCEWDSRIDRVTFAANEETTRLSLESRGLDIRSAIGMSFPCMTECGEDGKDYFFDGKFVQKEDGEVVVQAVHPEQLPAPG